MTKTTAKTVGTSRNERVRAKKEAAEQNSANSGADTVSSQSGTLATADKKDAAEKEKAALDAGPKTNEPEEKPQEPAEDGDDAAQTINSQTGEINDNASTGGAATIPSAGDPDPRGDDSQRGSGSPQGNIDPGKPGSQQGGGDADEDEEDGEAEAGRTKRIKIAGEGTVPVHVDGGMRRLEAGKSIKVSEAEIEYLERNGVSFTKG